MRAGKGRKTLPAYTAKTLHRKVQGSFARPLSRTNVYYTNLHVGQNAIESNRAPV